MGMKRFGAFADWIAERLRMRKKSERQLAELEARREDELIREIWQAHRDWKIAGHKFQQALDPDQIDYAIYIMEAAEKRYEMLLRQAKERERARKDAEASGSAATAHEAPAGHMRTEQAGKGQSLEG